GETPDTGAVDDDLRTPQVGGNRVRRGLHRVGIGDVDAIRAGGSTLFGDLARRLLRGVDRDVEARDERALIRQLPCRRVTEARTGAGHDRYSSIEASHRAEPNAPGKRPSKGVDSAATGGSGARRRPMNEGVDSAATGGSGARRRPIDEAVAADCDQL